MTRGLLGRALRRERRARERASRGRKGCSWRMDRRGTMAARCSAAGRPRGVPPRAREVAERLHPLRAPRRSAAARTLGRPARPRRAACARRSLSLPAPALAPAPLCPSRCRFPPESASSRLLYSPLQSYSTQRPRWQSRRFVGQKFKKQITRTPVRRRVREGELQGEARERGSPGGAQPATPRCARGDAIPSTGPCV